MASHEILYSPFFYIYNAEKNKTEDFHDLCIKHGLRISLKGNFSEKTSYLLQQWEASRSGGGEKKNNKVKSLCNSKKLSLWCFSFLPFVSSFFVILFSYRSFVTSAKCLELLLSQVFSEPPWSYSVESISWIGKFNTYLNYL